MIGAFPNPEELAYGLSGLPERPLYKVGFRQTDLWDDYEGPAEDRLYADIYEHWLELAERGTYVSDHHRTREAREDHEPLRRAHQGHRGSAPREGRSHGA